MKHIAIYCVNYHSYDSLKNYLASIDASAKEVTGAVSISVFVADNTEQPLTVESQPACFSLQVIPTGENKGYFGAIRLLMERFRPAGFDYAIISNVDVLLDKGFFALLNDLQTDAQTGWIAPQIYSNLEHRDRNPKIMQRYPKRKLQILQALFRMPFLYNLYTHTVYKSKVLVKHSRGEMIYAGHGSFIILTKRYFEACGIINYPVFLFCEEIYLGEVCQQHGLKVIYEPGIRVNDAEHASTGTFRRSKYCQYNYQALSYILKTYY